MAPLRVCVLTVAGLLAIAAPVRAEYDVRVDLKNVSGQVKTDWPVVLKVYTVLGRNLPAGSVNPDGFHVYDPAGKEVPHAVEVIPPGGSIDAPGNDELIFIVPKMDPEQTLSYRIVNNKTRSPVKKDIDCVNSPHNLIANGDFENAADAAPADFTGQGKQDAQVKHSGKASLALSADGANVSAKHAKVVPLHKDSWYYFGAWSKTDNVSRFGFEAGNGAYFKFTYLDPPTTQPADAAFGFVMSQCSTRDWLKCTFEGGVGDWGLERYVAKARGTKANIEFVLEQRKHYYMAPGKTRGTWWLDSVVLMEQPEVTVRFDQVLQPLLKDGVFLFARGTEAPLGQLDEKRQPPVSQWYGKPFAHEKLSALDRFAVKGQRVWFGLGVYHTRALKSLLVRSDGPALVGPDGAKVPLDIVEYCPGFGPGGSRAMTIISTQGGVEPVTPSDKEGVRFFFLTYVVPRDAKCGQYVGKVDVLADDALVQSVPLTLRVQDMEQPILRDLYVGLIYQGGDPVPLNDEMLKQYGRCGFSNLMIFSRFIPYQKGADGKMHVDPDGLAKQMQRLLDNGITGSCGLYSEVQVDDKPKGHAGVMISMARQEVAEARQAAMQKSATTQLAPEVEAALPTEKSVYFRLLKELDAVCKRHPEWPAIVHMNWDEPQHRQWSPKMGWTNEALPDAISTLDVQFSRMDPLLKFYNTPAFDDPADWAGPELFKWIRTQTRDFGMCGAAGADDERSRYQVGMLVATSGMRYFHAWHHGFALLFYRDKKVQRGIAAVSYAAGMNDLKAWRLLTQTIAEAKKSGRNPQAVQAAEQYLAKVFSVFNGDTRRTWPCTPYLGLAYTWGCDGFYDDWQEQLLRHAAAIKGVKWLD